MTRQKDRALADAGRAVLYAAFALLTATDERTRAEFSRILRDAVQRFRMANLPSKEWIACPCGADYRYDVHNVCPMCKGERKG